MTGDTRAARAAAQMRFGFLNYEDDKALATYLNMAVSRTVRGRRQRALMRSAALGRDILRHRERIDEGVPLAAALADEHDVPPWIARALCNFDRLANDPISQITFDEAIRWLTWVGPDRSPKNSEVKGFCAAMRQIEEIAAYVARDPMELAQQVTGSWKDYNAQLNEYGGCKRLERFLGQFIYNVHMPEVFSVLRKMGRHRNPALRDWLRQDWTTPEFGDLGGAIFAGKSALGILKAITHNDRGG